MIYCHITRAYGNFIFHNYSFSLLKSCQARNIPMMGKLITYVTLPDTRIVHGDERDKWIIPPYLLDDDIPDFLSGSLFLIPKWAISCLATAIWKTPIMVLEDMYTTGLLAHACKVPRADIRNFNGQPHSTPNKNDIEHVAASLDHVVYHLGSTSVTSEAKKRLFNGFIDLYHWTLPPIKIGERSA